MKRQYKKLADTLIKGGIKENPAKILACLYYLKEGTSKDIEKITSLKPPDICRAMKYLREKGWVKIKGEKKIKNRRKPFNIYTLAVPFSVIVDNIQKELKKKLENIERIQKELERAL